MSQNDWVSRIQEMDQILGDMVAFKEITPELTYNNQSILGDSGKKIHMLDETISYLGRVRKQLIYEYGNSRWQDNELDGLVTVFDPAMIEDSMQAIREHINGEEDS
jgi:hypothetical protein